MLTLVIKYVTDYSRVHVHVTHTYNTYMYWVWSVQCGVTQHSKHILTNVCGSSFMTTVSHRTFVVIVVKGVFFQTSNV